MKKIIKNNNLINFTCNNLVNAHLLHIAKIFTLTLTLIILCAGSSQADENMKYIALDADLSGNTKAAGTALKRGIELAIQEINEKGGVLGAPLGLKTFDHRANPARGVYNIDRIAEDEDILAIIGGVHTPVALEQLEKIHQHKIPYLGAWAAGTPIVDNGYEPNYVFRLSVRDEYAAPFFIQEAQKRGYKNIALFLEKTGWGRSNHKALHHEASQAGINIATTQWFFWGYEERDFDARLEELDIQNIDAIILVANVTEGSAFIKSLARQDGNKRPAVISHWGISSSHFPDFTGPEIYDVDLSFLQTWSLCHTGATSFKEKYCKAYGPCDTVHDFPAPVGTAHAYDLTHMLAKALMNEQSLSRVSAWKGLQNISVHHGLIKKYEFPFTKSDREALSVDDFGLYRYNRKGEIVKIK